MTLPAQEPWDYERFLETYNAIAQERSGWYYVAKGGRTETGLEQRYYAYPQYFPSMFVFAEGLFVSDQLLD